MGDGYNITGVCHCHEERRWGARLISDRRVAFQRDAPWACGSYSYDRERRRDDDHVDAHVYSRVAFASFTSLFFPGLIIDRIFRNFWNRLYSTARYPIIIRG